MKYTGTIIWNIISMIFCIAVLNSVYGNFETIAVSLLVIILVSVNQGFAQLGLTNVGQTLSLYSKIQKMQSTQVKTTEKREILDTNDDIELDLEDFDEDEEVSNNQEDIEELKQAQELLEIQTNKFYIVVTCNFIVWAWAIITILGAI